MIIEISEKVHIVVRRTFETDLRRHFIGEVKAVNHSIARIEGYFMVFDKSKNTFIKKPSLRDTIMDLSSCGYWVNIIPRNIDINELKYVYSSNNQLILTDENAFKLDINEFGALR
ncbi:MAG: hypothetical protein KJP07_08460 [Desulfatitalea sp.]|nr:hypothetical protein [Desulfatitalea sp.]